MDPRDLQQLLQNIPVDSSADGVATQQPAAAPAVQPPTQPAPDPRLAILQKQQELEQNAQLPQLSTAGRIVAGLAPIGGHLSGDTTTPQQSIQQATSILQAPAAQQLAFKRQQLASQLGQTELADKIKTQQQLEDPTSEKSRQIQKGYRAMLESLLKTASPELAAKINLDSLDQVPGHFLRSQSVDSVLKSILTFDKQRTEKGNAEREKADVRIQQAAQKLAGLSRLGNGPYVQAMNNIYSAQKGLDMIDAINRGELRSNPAAEIQLNSDLAGIMSNGGHPAHQIVMAISAKTGLKDVAQVAQWITAHPQDSLTKSMLDQMGAQYKTLLNTAQDKTLDTVRSVHRSLTNDFKASSGGEENFLSAMDSMYGTGFRDKLKKNGSSMDKLQRGAGDPARKGHPSDDEINAMTAEQLKAYLGEK